MKLDLTPFQQETEYTCLPACIRTVLAHFGVVRTEEQVAHACETNFAGTVFASALDGVRRLGLQVVRLDGGTFEDLTGYLRQDLPGSRESPPRCFDPEPEVVRCPVEAHSHS